jgi:hypothetical protein
LKDRSERANCQTGVTTSQEAKEVASILRKYLHHMSRTNTLPAPWMNAALKEPLLPSAAFTQHLLASLPHDTHYHHKREGILHDFASRCLLTLGLYPEALEQKQRRSANPSPDYFRAQGTQAFVEINQDFIAEHFLEWEKFMQAKFHVN